MSKEIYISSTPHETRLAIVEKDELTEIYYERENEYTLAGSIYNGRVTRVLPGMQSSFVDIGLERDAFLYITDFMEEAGEAADFESAGREPRPANREPGNSERGAESGNGQRASERSGERGDRRGGRGRRERGGREERPRGGEAAPAEAQSFAPVEEERYVEPVAAAPLSGDAAEIGEGAPGADGSRRWRGRRGRRRGRGGAEGSAVDAAPTGDSVEIEPAEAAPAETKPERSFEPREPREPRESREFREPRADRGGRDARGPRQDAIRERFAPRGQRGRGERAAGGETPVDIQASATPAVEPLILPGESLSKYRRGESAEAVPAAKPATANLVTARPSTEVTPLVGWDGGATLPGEVLSRHRERGGEARTESRSSESRSESRGEGRGSDRRRDRDERRGRGPREEFRPKPPEFKRQEFKPQGLEPIDAVQPGVTAQHVVESYESQPYETQTDAAPVEIAANEAEVAQAVEEFHETVAEYEPGADASASYRVDPSGPSEFRQGAPVLDEETEEPLPAGHTSAAVQPSFTAIQPSGEMISDVAPAATPAAPIEHEQAVQSVHLDEAQRAAVPFAGGFAPGDGQLEEELLDDEEGEAINMHAAADDELEEETLEHAADLGSMIRDLSIDQITRPEPVELDEGEDIDFEDDDFEEDELDSAGEEPGEEELSGSEVSEAEEEEYAEAASLDEGEPLPVREGAAPEGAPARREGGRRGRRDGRRGGRDRGGERPAERGNGDRATERSGERSNGERSNGERSAERSSSSGQRDRRGMAGSRSGDRRGRHSVQASDLPAIGDLLKPGQEVLVQIAKEPIAKKGARITSHIALPGRFLVFMPTVGHVGVSRKIESDAERRRLKEVLLSERGEASGGFIVRTAAAGASEEELRSDLRFLLNLWTDIKARSESSKSPALIYHDLNLIERILRDQVTDNFSAIWVDTEAEYERVLRFLQRFQPALIRRVKLYGKDTPLFEQFGINAEIDKALRSKVWLKSGGSIVINQTEALVAIDINTGKYVGKTTKLEDTIVKTNLDAIPEIVRQIRLRDLGGIIIIDFIDMDERKNRNRVMAALEEELKKDRAPSKVLQFNDFGLVAITRKRVKQSLERTLSTTCGVCQGTGMTKSPVTVCNDLYIEMRKMHKTIEKGDILLRVHPEVVKQLKSNGGKWLQEMEEMSGKTILVKSDPTLHPEQFDIH